MLYALAKESGLRLVEIVFGGCHQERDGHDVVQVRKPKRPDFRGRVLGDDALDHDLIVRRRDHVDHQPHVPLRVKRQVVQWPQ